MGNDTKVFGMFHRILFFWLAGAFFLSTILFGDESAGKAETAVENKSGFALAADEGLLTLHAQNASLYEIIEELGKLMKIEVVGNIHEKEKVSADFDKVSLKEALEKLSINYGYQMDSDDDGDDNNGHSSLITKIIILPKGREKELSEITSKDQDIQEKQTEEPKRPEPFIFEFDPRIFMEEEQNSNKDRP
ncbi:MAG: hypothetical protein MRK01_15525 [Candidatus Scalindua sp.]|nr:hypothetical protein [Candidatus Scalindua sp.]